MSADPTAAKRSLLAYAICLPLAAILGYLVSDPLNRTSVIMGSFLLFLVMLPLLMRWYHAWLIAVWNSYLLFAFLPGQISGWTLMAILGFGIAIGHYILNRERKFLETPSVSWSLIFLAIVVFVTAMLRGGIGLHVLGDESIGGKRYVLIWVAMAGYVVFKSQPIAPDKRKLMTILFVLSGATAIISDLASLAGGPFVYISLIFPLTNSSTFTNQPAFGAETVERFGGVGNGCLAIAMTLLACYGIERMLNPRRIWRAVLFLGALFLTTFGGFRGLLIFAIMMIFLVFLLEGLHQSRLMPVAVLTFILVACLMFAFSDRLPLPFQRCISFVPGVRLSEIAKRNAEESSDWRLEMWRGLVPLIPQYLWLGKGLGIDANDLASYYDFGGNQVGGEVGGTFAVSGDYHSGPLSVILQFGIWGALGFIWFLVACLRVLWANYKYGDPDIKRYNTFLLAYFTAKIIMFFFVFGSFYSDMMIFTGLIGFSVSLNGGAAKPAPVVQPRVAFNRFRPLPLPATTG